MSIQDNDSKVDELEKSIRNLETSHAHWNFPRWNLDNVIDALRVSREIIHNIRQRGRIRELPSREALVKILDGLTAALFPTHYGRPDLSDESIDYFVGNTLNTTLTLLNEQVRRGLLFADEHDTLSDSELTQRSQSQPATSPRNCPPSARYWLAICRRRIRAIPQPQTFRKFCSDIRA